MKYYLIQKKWVYINHNLYALNEVAYFGIFMNTIIIINGFLFEKRTSKY